MSDKYLGKIISSKTKMYHIQNIYVIILLLRFSVHRKTITGG